MADKILTADLFTWKSTRDDFHLLVAAIGCMPQSPYWKYTSWSDRVRLGLPFIPLIGPGLVLYGVGYTTVSLMWFAAMTMVSKRIQPWFTTYRAWILACAIWRQ